MKDRGVGSWIQRRATMSPDRVAIVSGANEWTYAKLAGRVRRLANGLSDLGVHRGDRVAWLGSNHPAFLETLFASATLGAVVTPVNHRLEPSILRSIVEDSSPRIAVVSGTADLALPPIVETLVRIEPASDSDIAYEQLVQNSVDAPIDAGIALRDLCMLPYTSGTTGVPKGVMLTHGNITWNVVNFLSSADFLSDDVTIAIAPFFRVGGTGVNVLPVLFKGGTVVIPQSSDGDEILSLIQRHRVTVGFGNPDLLEALVGSPLWSSADLSSVRFFVTGGAPVPERLIQTYFERGITFVQGYGLSEAAPLALLLDPENALRKAGSAGKPALLVDVRIAGRDGTECSAQETGELLVRGPNVMAGYWNRSDATKLAIDGDGWLHTGDAARADDEGYIQIVGRMRDTYTSSEELVYPGDIERVLLMHPSVADAGVVGIRTGEGGAGHAFVVPGKGIGIKEEDLLAFCRERLKPYEVPKAITIVDLLPRNSVGKLLRHELEAMAREPLVEGSR